MANKKQLPREFVDNYSQALGNLTDDCKARMMDDLLRVDLSDIARARDEIIVIMQGYLGIYTDMAAEMAATFFDGVRKYQKARGTYTAIAQSGYSPKQTDEAVRGMIQTIVDDPAATAAFYKKIMDATVYCIKSAAANTTMQNARRDPAKPRYARVPEYTPATYVPWGKEKGVTHNPDLAATGTCPFCSMLASRGFVYYSAKAAGEDQHWHEGCDCVVVPSYNDAGAAGYDPEAYLQDWQDSMSRVAKERAEEDGTSYVEEFNAIEKHYSQAGSASKYASTERREQTQQYARVRYAMNRLGM